MLPAAMVVREKRLALDWNVYSGPRLEPAEPDSSWRRSSCSVAELAALLHTRNEPIVFLEGRAELGPRALGSRSILAPATHESMRDRLNDMKLPEWYRPVAPICLEHRAPAIFDPGIPDPYMLYDHHVRETWRSRIPAVCHIDGTARLQTSNASSHQILFELLTEYEALSGVPVLCNTSANDLGRGFFPDVASASRWGRVPTIWSAGTLFEKTA